MTISIVLSKAGSLCGQTPGVSTGSDLQLATFARLLSVQRREAAILVFPSLVLPTSELNNEVSESSTELNLAQHLTQLNVC